MVYLAHKASRGQQYYYLVKSFKHAGRVEKVQHYLGARKPTDEELVQLKRELTPRLELDAAERLAQAAADSYRTPYLAPDALLGLERLRFLERARQRLRSPEAQARENIRAELLDIHGTLALEQRELAREQVEAVLLHDRVPPGLKLAQVLEVINLRRLRREAHDRTGRPDQRWTLKLHDGLFQGRGRGGKLRRTNATLPGSAFVPPPPVLLTDELDGLFQWYNEASSLHPFERAVLFHHHFQQLRPFDHGNGVVGRLLFDQLLDRTGLPPPCWRRGDRDRYLAALVAGDRGDKARLIGNIWELYRSHHRAGVAGELSALREEATQAHLEEF